MLDKGTLYGYRVHARETEDDPHLATLMYAYSWEGPWHDMVTGAPGYIDEVLTALAQLNESAGWLDQVAVLEDEIERLRIAGDNLVAAIRNHDLREAHVKAWEEARRG